MRTQIQLFYGTLYLDLKLLTAWKNKSYPAQAIEWPVRKIGKPNESKTQITWLFLRLMKIMHNIKDHKDQKRKLNSLAISIYSDIIWPSPFLHRALRIFIYLLSRISCCRQTSSSFYLSGLGRDRRMAKNSNFCLRLMSLQSLNHCQMPASTNQK